MQHRLLLDWAHGAGVCTFELPTNYRSGSSIVHAGAASLGGWAQPAAPAAAAKRGGEGEGGGDDERMSLRVVPAPGALKGSTVLHYAKDDWEEVREVRGPARPPVRLSARPSARPPARLSARQPSQRRTALPSQVADSMLRLNGDEGVPFGEMAVIYRTHKVSSAMERELRSRGIKYLLLSGTSLFDREEARVRPCSNPVRTCARTPHLLCRPLCVRTDERVRLM